MPPKLQNSSPTRNLFYKSKSVDEIYIHQVLLSPFELKVPRKLDEPKDSSIIIDLKSDNKDL
jgi:hypothetical protein